MMTPHHNVLHNVHIKNVSPFAKIIFPRTAIHSNKHVIVFFLLLSICLDEGLVLQPLLYHYVFKEFQLVVLILSISRRSVAVSVRNPRYLYSLNNSL